MRKRRTIKDSQTLISIFRIDLLYQKRVESFHIHLEIMQYHGTL